MSAKNLIKRYDALGPTPASLLSRSIEPPQGASTNSCDTVSFGQSGEISAINHSQSPKLDPHKAQELRNILTETDIADITLSTCEISARDGRGKTHLHLSSFQVDAFNPDTPTKRIMKAPTLETDIADKKSPLEPETKAASKTRARRSLSSSSWQIISVGSASEETSNITTEGNRSDQASK